MSYNLPPKSCRVLRWWAIATMPHSHGLKYVPLTASDFPSCVLFSPCASCLQALVSGAWPSACSMGKSAEGAQGQPQKLAVQVWSPGLLAATVYICLCSKGFDVRAIYVLSDESKHRICCACRLALKALEQEDVADTFLKKLPSETDHYQFIFPVRRCQHFVSVTQFLVD
jgi:hypothetical protein